STRTRAAIENSLIVAEAYLRDNAQTVRSDIIAMSFEIGRNKTVFDQDASKLRQYLTFQASVRGLAAAIVLDKDLQVIARGEINVSQTFALPPRDALAHITSSEPQIVLLPDTNYVAAIVKLDQFDDYYLYLTRLLDPRVVPELQATRASVQEYAALESRRVGVQVAFALMYTVIALIVMLSAVWIGLNFANRLVAPIRRLIGAANLVSTGNLHVRVPVREGEGDLANLGETFNRMTQELRTQRDDIMRAHDVIDSRRRFTEAVLAGASAGVIGVDADGNVTILNRSAEKLIGSSEAEALGKPLTGVFPELADIMAAAHAGSGGQDQVTISRKGRERNLSVRVTSEQSGDSHRGYVITLDDVTELVAAQRTSAWADVARRIAHEIKNPLTPIQLSAERLRRKYGKTITEDRDVFERCTETIIRQVGDVTRMVDEFSAFARTPKPEMQDHDIRELVRSAVLDRQMMGTDVAFETKVGREPIIVSCDRRLISQAVANVVKNAQEAIQAFADGPNKEPGWTGRIETNVRRNGDKVDIEVIDNGAGLPKHNRNRLLEPYVTTKGNKGTGLGLAIVQKSVEQHGGTLSLEDAPVGPGRAHGALLRISLPLGSPPAGQTSSPPERAAASGNA